VKGYNEVFRGVLAVHLNFLSVKSARQSTRVKA